LKQKCVYAGSFSSLELSVALAASSLRFSAGPVVSGLSDASPTFLIILRLV